MLKACRLLIFMGLCLTVLCCSNGIASATVTAVTQLDIPDRVSTLDEGTGGLRKMILFNIEVDKATTLSHISIWLEGANLQSQGAGVADGYERGVNSIAIFLSNANGDILGQAFGGHTIYNNYYSSTPQTNAVRAYSNYVWGSASQIFLNLATGNNHFIIVYDYEAPNFQPAGTTRTIAGERYNVRVDYVTESGGGSFIANIMGPYLIVAGNIVGTTFVIDKLKYFDRDQIGIPVDPVVIAAIKVTATGMPIIWNDLLIRAYGSGNDTRVARIHIFEDTTGDGVFTPESMGPPQDALIDVIDIPFTADNGQSYRIFTTPITIPADTTRTYFICYEFDPNAPDPVNNEFGFSVVNFGGTFGIVTPYDLTELVGPKVRLFPLPPGVEVTLGDESPATGFVNSTPLLTQRWEMMQVKLSANKMDVYVSNVTFQWTQTNTGRATDLYSLELWMDANNSGRGVLDASDVLLSTLSRTEILANTQFFRFALTQSLLIQSATSANILLVAIFTDQAQNAYSFAMFGDGVSGNFTYVRFYPTPAPLFSGFLVFSTTPPISPTPPTPTPPVVTQPLPPVFDGGSGGALPNDGVGVGLPGSIYQGEGGGCFVATAVFGSILERDVIALCDLRDYSLASTQASGIVGLYYRVGPNLAEALRQIPSGRILVRQHLLPLLQLAK